MALAVFGSAGAGSSDALGMKAIVNNSLSLMVVLMLVAAKSCADDHAIATLGWLERLDGLTAEPEFLLREAERRANTSIEDRVGFGAVGGRARELQRPRE